MPPIERWIFSVILNPRKKVLKCYYISTHAHHTDTAHSMESVFGHSTGRWLYNDQQQRQLRYTPFNVEALKDIACQSTGASLCTKFTKLGEGSFNKVFLLELDNGIKATARIPTTPVGNLELATASEAATLTYLLESNRGKVPRVLAWSASGDANPVRWPYIIIEYVPGFPLVNNWLKIRGKPVATVISSLLLNDTLVSCPAFSQIGSLYFKEDVSPELQARPLFALDQRTENSARISQKYRIGPIADREWWRRGYGSVEADRGPWPDTASFIAAAARLQQQCISENVDFNSPYLRSREEDIPELQKLLDCVIAASPYLAPANEVLARPTMAHPDLNPSNIIVVDQDKAQYKIIDWQGTVIVPFFMQSGIPPAIAYTSGVIDVPIDGSMPLFPQNVDQLPHEEQENIRLHHTLACRHRLYMKNLAEFDPRFPCAWALPHWELMGWLILRISRLLASGPVALRQDLIMLEDMWAEISAVPCPFHFTAEERANHEAVFSDYETYSERVQMLKDCVGCDEDGWVRNEDFDKAQRLTEEIRQVWNPKEEKGPFPFEEGSYSYFLT